MVSLSGEKSAERRLFVPSSEQSASEKSKSGITSSCFAGGRLARDWIFRKRPGRSRGKPDQVEKCVVSPFSNPYPIHVPALPLRPLFDVFLFDVQGDDLLILLRHHLSPLIDLDLFHLLFSQPRIILGRQDDL